MSGTGPDTPTVPDEAVLAAVPHVDAANHVQWADKVDEARCETCRQAMGRTRAALTAAAPHIVAANRAEPDSDLRETLVEAFGHLPDGWRAEPPYRATAAYLLSDLQAYVDGQVAAARAEERAKLVRTLAISMDSFGHLAAADEIDEEGCRTCREAMQRARRALGVEGD